MLLRGKLIGGLLKFKAIESFSDDCLLNLLVYATDTRYDVCNVYMHWCRIMANSVPINMKAEVQVRNLIDRAAKLLHRNRTEFVLDAATQRAEEVILDQQFITVDEERYERFVAALDAPPANNPRLQNLMAHRAPWE